MAGSHARNVQALPRPAATETTTRVITGDRGRARYAQLRANRLGYTLYMERPPEGSEVRYNTWVLVRWCDDIGEFIYSGVLEHVEEFMTKAEQRGETWQKSASR